MKRRMLLAAVVPMALLAFLPAVEAGAELGPPAEAGGGGDGGFHGFAQFDTHAQGQVVTLTGFLNAFREDNSVVGAVSEINGPPATSRNIAAFFLRGQGATFVYGVLGGPGGGRGTLPDPPPGEANAYYPTDEPPYEMTWTGPITGLGIPQVVDSKFHAKATDVPTGRADGAVTALTSPGHFSIGQATVVSHTEPADGGVVAESVSVVHEVKVGPAADPEHRVAGLLLRPDQRRSEGHRHAPWSTAPRSATRPSRSPTRASSWPTRPTRSTRSRSTRPWPTPATRRSGCSRRSPRPARTARRSAPTAGTLEFVKHDEEFGASNPQGFSGGGFSIGGAEAVVNTQRCSPDCGGGGGGGSTDIVGAGPGDTGTDGSTSTEGAGSESLPDDTTSGGTGDGSSDGGYSASGTLTTDTSGGGLGGGSTNLSGGTGDGLTGASGSTSASTGSVTSPSEQAAAGVSTPGAGVAVQQQAVAFTELGPKSAEWLRDLYLMAGLALGIIFVGQRLARAFCVKERTMERLKRDHARQLVAGALVVAALVVLTIGYANIRDEIQVAAQMPYVLTGGIGALILTGLGMVVLRSQDDKTVLDRWACWRRPTTSSGSGSTT